jgi:molecular chaperone GrpE
MDKTKKKHDEIEEDVEQKEETNASEEPENNEIQILNEKVAEFEEKWKRALADYRNLENRMQEQRGEWVRSANKDLLLRLLPVLDTLLLAFQHTQDKTLQVSVTQFLDILKSEGVTKIEAVGKDFDPVAMECVVTDAGDENKVLEELRPGFMLHDKILRPAQVKVGNGK